MNSDSGLSTEDLARSGDRERRDAGDPAGAVATARAGAQPSDTATQPSDTATDLRETSDATADGGFHDTQAPPAGAPREDEGLVRPTDDSMARAGGPGSGDVALLGASDQERFQQRWSDAQSRFVDDPQEAVRSADALVAELMQSLAQGFSEHKTRLEQHWRSGGDADTEELRQALQRYRSFFNRLLST